MRRKKVKDMPRKQQKAVMSKVQTIKPSTSYNIQKMNRNGGLKHVKGSYSSKKVAKDDAKKYLKNKKKGTEIFIEKETESYEVYKKKN